MKLIRIISGILVLLILLTSCATYKIGTSSESLDKMKSLGYTAETVVFSSDTYLPIQQLTVLKAIKGSDFINVYFFTNESDCELYFETYRDGLTSNVERCEVHRYIIVRGTQTAVNDFYQ